MGMHKILGLHGDVDYFSMSELKNVIFKLINEKIPSIILDMRDVEYMDSSGIGLIVTAHKAMHAYNGTIGLINVHEDIMLLLKLATVDSFLKIYNNEDDIK
ncbi:MAG: hypothetical protein A2176_04765 [Spirochaetes bacterium RBG_13_51_14]|nr:MAG: hypothetical protein A2176_04765 [Spirochaetes bacterium RBG_13_51_14]